MLYKNLPLLLLLYLLKKRKMANFEKTHFEKPGIYQVPNGNKTLLHMCAFKPVY